LLVDSPKTHTIIAKGDSAATNHYITEQDSLCLKNIKPNNSINVTLPNSVAISSNKQGELPLSNQLSTKGKTAIVLPDLTSSSLVSLGQLCDDGCEINLDKHKLSVYKDEDLIIEGARNKTDGL